MQPGNYVLVGKSLNSVPTRRRLHNKIASSDMATTRQ